MELFISAINYRIASLERSDNRTEVFAKFACCIESNLIILVKLFLNFSLCECQIYTATLFFFLLTSTILRPKYH